MTSKRIWTVAIIAVLNLLTMSALGQSVGTVSGTIKDAGGGVVPGVTVEAVNQGTGIVRVAVTDDSGTYVIPLLPIGVYTVTAEMVGFTTNEILDVILEVGQSRTLDFVLQVAQVDTSLTVTSVVQNVELQRSDATLAQVVHSEQVEDLPLNGRNFVQLALLGPGVTTGRQGSFLAEGPSSEVSYRGTMSVSAQGMRENSNDWLYDGIDNNELSAGGIAILPSVDSIAEFKVMTYNFSAQYGSRGGTTVLVSTKSGTNDFHGSVFWFNRNDALDARNFFDGPEKGRLDRNQYGFSLGGPVIQDKTFFFGGFEGTNLRQGLTIQSTVPTALMHEGNFTQVATIYDPATTTFDSEGVPSRTPFSGNIIPSERIDPIGKALLDLMPLPTRTDRLSNNYLSNPVKTLDNYSFYGRVDHEISDQDKLFVRISFEDGEQFLPSGVPEFAARSSFSSNQTFSTDARNIAVAYTRVFSPTTINQFTAGYNRVFNFITSFGYLSNKSEELGIPGANLGGDDTSSLTRMSFSGFIGVGDRGFSPFQGGTNVYHLADTVTLVRGAHTLNIGGVARIQQLNQFGDSALAGAFSFNNFFTAGFTPSGSFDGSTGSSIASLLLGLPSSGSRNDLLQGSVKGRRWKEYRGFVDDTFRVNPDLTLTLGLAYALTTPQSEAADRFSNFDFYTGQYFVGGTIGVKTDYSNIQPRFGFAWSPGGSTNMVLRGGYGIFHDYAAQGGAQGPVSNAPFANSYFFSSNNIDPVRTLATGFPDNSQPVPVEEATSWTTIDPNYKQGRIQQWNVNIERKLPGSMVAMLSYAGTHGDRLFHKGRNLNTATPGPGFNPRERRTYPDLENVSATIDHSTLDYHSMQIRLERRSARGGFLLASYTWSKGLTEGQTGLGGDPGIVYFPLDPWPNADKAANNTDLRHNFRLSYLFELPFGSDLDGVSRTLLHGWNFNSIIVAHSGYPLAMSMQSNQSGTALGNRPDRVCNGKLSDPSIDGWFDTSCFVAPAVGTLGNAARTTLFGPGRWNFDLAVSKNFAFNEEAALQFRAELFNAFNHAQFAPPSTRVGGFGFGTIGSTIMTSRQIQIALKFVF